MNGDHTPAYLDRPRLSGRCGPVRSDRQAPGARFGPGLPVRGRASRPVGPRDHERAGADRRVRRAWRRVPLVPDRFGAEPAPPVGHAARHLRPGLPADRPVRRSHHDLPAAPRPGLAHGARRRTGPCALLDGAGHAAHRRTRRHAPALRAAVVRHPADAGPRHRPAADHRGAAGAGPGRWRARRSPSASSPRSPRSAGSSSSATICYRRCSACWRGSAAPRS